MPALTRDPNPLHTTGLSQPQRRRPALSPSFWQADERGMAELLQFANAFASEVGIRFFDETNQPDSGEAWQALMDYQRYVNLDELSQSTESATPIAPHMALFVAFLHLFGRAQERLNTFTKKHLDYYYQEVLSLANRPPVADDVFVLFELAKNATEQIVVEKTELDAKKDATRQPLTYQTTDALTVNRAAVAFVRNVYRNPVDSKVYYAPVANTLDGIAKPLNPARPFWNAFGPILRPVVDCGAVPTLPRVNRPEARLGFALASGVLQLAEGTRTITVTLTTKSAAPNLAGVALRLELSGEKSWLTLPDATKLTVSNLAASFSVTLPDSLGKEAVVGFQSDTLDGNYATTQPVLRCWLDNTADYPKLKDVQLDSIKIDVAVTGLKKSLILENDLGPVNPEKPFMPFGATPSVQSSLYVGCAEAVAKNLSSVKVSIAEWVGLPSNWSTYYGAYGDSFKKQENFTATTELLNGNLKGNKDQRKLFVSYVASVPPAPAPFIYIPFVLPYFGVFPNYILRDGGYVPMQRVFFFTPAGPVATRSVSDALLRIKPDQDFGHQQYPKLLTEKVIANITTPGTAIPNQPYTPLAKELTLDYNASTGDVALKADATVTDFAGRGLQLLHLGPFGQAEEHPFLKPLDFLDTDLTGKNGAYLVPQFNGEGTFLLGLRDVGPGEAVSLLILVAEGSANPEREPATVVWSVLVSNQWRTLGTDELLSDTTNHLLTSGIVKLSLPLDTTTDNTLLDTGFVWLRATLMTPAGTPAPPDSVADWLAIYTQAVRARFVNAGNDKAHANTPLAPDTIQKLRQPLATIKAVQQPEASTNGQPAETDDAFYTRISERLRHKNRAVSSWDYEHLILQAFPTIYKTKCLRHTRLEGNVLKDLAPGNVLVIAVPDQRGRTDVLASEIDRLEPKVDLGTLTQVTNFLKQRMGKLLNVAVVNPAYERVKVSAKVAFRPGYEFAPYSRQLKRDLTAFLAPWSQSVESEIRFEGTLAKSDVIAFVERLPYVDFLTELTLQQFGEGLPIRADNEVVQASNARAVLTSCPNHDIKAFDNC